MPSPAPFAPLPPELLFSVRPATWRALFAVRGFPPPLTPATFPTASLAAIADALSRPDLPLPLFRALVTIWTFATDAGRADIYAAAEALAYPTRWPDASSPADLIALLLAASATDDAARDVLEAAQILRDRSFRARTTQIYIGSPGPDPVVGEPTQYEAHWHREVAAWCIRRDFGDVVAVRGRTVSSVLTYEILHEDRPTPHLAVTLSTKTSAPALTSSSHRSVRSHLVRYAPATRRLSITTDCTEATTPLASIAGVVFFGNPRHFLDEQAVDLWKLQELGAAALAIPSLATEITVSAIGGTWHSGKNHAVTPRGHDFYKAISRYKIRIEGGRLDLVTLRAKRPSGTDGPAQCDVALRPPHLLTVSEPELAPLMHEFLDRAQITSPAPRILDFFSLQPWIGTGVPWTAFEGEAGFAQNVASGLLRADTTNRAVTPPDHPHAGRTATAYPLRGGRFLAWSPDPTIAPFVVRAEDLVVYTLSFSKLASIVAEALGLEAPATALDDDGVLYCGRRELGPIHVLVFLLTRPIRPATVERLREAADHGHAVLITPEGRMEKNGLRQVAMPKLAGPWKPLLGAIVRALKVEAFVDTTLYAPADARVVLHRATKRVWFDGVPCSKVSELQFKLLEFLVAQAGQPVHTRDIALHLRGGHWHGDTTRKAIESLVDALVRSFKALKKKPPKDLQTIISKPQHGHYALTVKSFVD